MNLHSFPAKAPRSTLLKNARCGALAVIAMTTLIGAADALASPERVEELVRLALQLDPDADRGAQVYGQLCAGCHRVNADGNASRLIPALAGQREAFLIQQLADFAELDRQAEQMHAVISKAALNEPQAWVDVAAYLSRLPTVRQPEQGSGRTFGQGAAIFAQNCVECHADDAHGDEDGFVPALRGQHYSYRGGCICPPRFWESRGPRRCYSYPDSSAPVKSGISISRGSLNSTA
jgi:cytochrome c553